MKTKTIGLALGGGGARGLAHIGVLKVLEREALPIACVAGTSMGGIIGAAVAAGVPAADMEAEALKVRRRREQVKLVDPKFYGTGLLKGSRIYKYMATLFGETLSFSDLRLPLALIAVDLISGNEVVLREGNVIDALRATISVPGVFNPVQYAGFRLVDGGVLNNVPVDVARTLGAEVVIAVDVLSDYRPSIPLPQPAQPRKRNPLTEPLVELWDIQMMMITALTRLRLKEAQPNLCIHPQISNKVGLILGFEHAEEVIAAGEAAAQASLPEIYNLINQSNQKDRLQ
jgi:NTE family protein